MIRVAFTLANNIAKRIRYSPTAIIQGREPTHLQTRILKSQQQEIKRQAEKHRFNAVYQNTACPFEREKLQINFEYSDKRSNLTFEDAWLKIDEVEQRQSDQYWKQFYAQRNASRNN